MLLKNITKANDSSFLSLLRHSTSAYSPTVTHHCYHPLSAIQLHPSRSVQRCQSLVVPCDTPLLLKCQAHHVVSGLPANHLPCVRAWWRLAPNRRGADQEKEKKSLWWKDKAGQGNLNDASLDNVSGHRAAVTHAHHAAVTNVCGTAARLFMMINSALPVGLKPDTVQDHIKLEHVMFNYPSHPNVPVVKGLPSCLRWERLPCSSAQAASRRGVADLLFCACVPDADVCHRARATGYPFRSLSHLAE